MAKPDRRATQHAGRVSGECGLYQVGGDGPTAIFVVAALVNLPGADFHQLDTGNRHKIRHSCRLSAMSSGPYAGRLVIQLGAQTVHFAFRHVLSEFDDAPVV